MISRSRCREIARDWCLQKGIEEWERRLRSIAQRDARMMATYPDFRPNEQHRRKLREDTVWALVDGYYDPPLPKLPNFWQRLWVEDWTPPEPDYPQWRMKSTERKGEEDEHI